MEPRLRAFARILPVYNQLFPENLLHDLWSEAQPRNYRYKIRPTAVPLVLLHAFASRAPSTAHILRQFGGTLGTTSRSTVSDLLANPVFAEFTRLLLLHFQDSTPPSAPAPSTSAPSTPCPSPVPPPCAAMPRRSTTTPSESGSRGCSTWKPHKGCCPLRMLKIHSGAWNDAAFLLTGQARLGLDEQATGVYDRGFSSHRSIAERLATGEHFLLRLRKNTGGASGASRAAGGSAR